MKPKPKHRAAPGPLAFIARWTLANIVGWMMALGLYETFSSFFNTYETANVVLVAIFPALVAALGQRVLIRQISGGRAWGWVMATGIGSLGAALSYYFYSNARVDAFIAIFLVLFVPPALVQAAWLSRQVRAAWLWVVAAAVSASVFSLPAQIVTANDAVQYLTLAAAALLQGSVMALTMRHLWTLRRAHPAKAKNKLDAEAELAEQAAARLHAEAEVAARVEAPPARALRRR